jgi:glutamate decarboxylase
MSRLTVFGWLEAPDSTGGGFEMAIHRASKQAATDLSVVPRFTRAGMLDVPKRRLPDGAMLPQTAYQIVLDEVMLDGNARFNLATFVTTWMDEEADRLYAATFDKNMVDKDEYPQTADIESRCVASRRVATLGSRPIDPTSSWAATSRSSGRSSPTTGRWNRATCPWRGTCST